MSKQNFSAFEPEIAAEEAKVASDRSVGIVFAAAFAVYGAWPLIHFSGPRLWALAIAATFVAAAVFAPNLLRPVSVVWLRFGALLHRIMTPMIMGIVFFLTVVPTGLIMRARGKNLLRLKREKNAISYWIERDPPGPHPRTMTRQF